MVFSNEKYLLGLLEATELKSSSVEILSTKRACLDLAEHYRFRLPRTSLPLSTF